MMRRLTKAVWVAGFVLLCVGIAVGIPSYRRFVCNRVVERFIADPCAPFSDGERDIVVAYVEKKGIYAALSPPLDREEESRLIQAAMRRWGTAGDSWVFQVISRRWASGHGFTQLPELVIEAVDAEVPNAGLAFTQMRAVGNRPTIDEIDIKRIMSKSRDEYLIITCILNFDIQEMLPRKRAYNRLLLRQDLPDRAKRVLLEYIDDTSSWDAWFGTGCEEIQRAYREELPLTEELVKRVLHDSMQAERE